MLNIGRGFKPLGRLLLFDSTPYRELGAFIPHGIRTYSLEVLFPVCKLLD
jgi:hypothetical protein